MILDGQKILWGNISIIFKLYFIACHENRIHLYFVHNFFNANDKLLWSKTTWELLVAAPGEENSHLEINYQNSVRCQKRNTIHVNPPTRVT